MEVTPPGRKGGDRGRFFVSSSEETKNRPLSPNLSPNRPVSEPSPSVRPVSEQPPTVSRPLPMSVFQSVLN